MKHREGSWGGCLLDSMRVRGMKPPSALVLLTPVTMLKLDRTPGTLPASSELTQSEGCAGRLTRLLVALGGSAPVWRAYADSSAANPPPASHRPSGSGSVVELSAVVTQTPLGPNI